MKVINYDQQVNEREKEDAELPEYYQMLRLVLRFHSDLRPIDASSSCLDKRNERKDCRLSPDELSLASVCKVRTQDPEISHPNDFVRELSELRDLLQKQQLLLKVDTNRLSPLLFQSYIG